jgi:hypothetical protein
MGKSQPDPSRDERDVMLEKSCALLDDRWPRAIDIMMP